jgi:hypothetical protein
MYTCLDLRSGYPDAPKPKATGPQCTALSFFCQLQRRYTPHRLQRPLLVRKEIRREMADKFCLWQSLGSLTCHKSATWGKQLYFPSQGRLRPGLNPRTRVPEASMLTARPPKPLMYTCLLLCYMFIWPVPHLYQINGMWNKWNEIFKKMLHLAVNTLHHHYKQQPVNAVYGTGRIY